MQATLKQGQTLITIINFLKKWQSITTIVRKINYVATMESLEGNSYNIIAKRAKFIHH